MEEEEGRWPCILMGDMRSTRWCACSCSVEEEGEEEAEEEEEEAVAGGGRGIGLAVMVGFGFAELEQAWICTHAQRGGEPACQEPRMEREEGREGPCTCMGGGWRVSDVVK